MLSEVVSLYKQNRTMAEGFIVSSFDELDLNTVDKHTTKALFSRFKAIDNIYKVDANWTQTSANFLRNRQDKSMIGTRKYHLSTKISLKENGTFVSSPYINTTTNKLSVTYLKKIDSGYTVFDLSIVAVLHRLSLLGVDYRLRSLNRYVYALIGFLLVFFALFLSLYAIFAFFGSVFPIGDLSLEATFKSIIALTLGLAIFDLAKTILEQDVFSKSLLESKTTQNKTFSKFLISIVIALSIESLMVVFKIALIDYKEMIYAFYLIVAVALMIIALGLYNYLSAKKKDE